MNIYSYISSFLHSHSFNGCYWLIFIKWVGLCWLHLPPTLYRFNSPAHHHFWLLALFILQLWTLMPDCFFRWDRSKTGSCVQLWWHSCLLLSHPSGPTHIQDIDPSFVLFLPSVHDFQPRCYQLVNQTFTSLGDYSAASKMLSALCPSYF